MKKIVNSSYRETYYKEVLNNGLTVLIFHKPEFISSICAFGTPYGGLHIHQKYEGKEYNFNPGIAHFLEHKLFETDEKDILNDFSAIGANVNAFTSHHQTVYYFSTNGDINKPLNMLLDFVQSFSVTEESVEKEKGIIAEELSMYMLDPASRLIDETYKAMYKNYPLKYDIGGTKDTVYAITKEELEECYRINYHPSNMVLVIASASDPEEVLKIVKDNQNKKTFIKKEKPVLNDKEEPFEVVESQKSFEMDVSKNKQVIAYKMKPNYKNVSEAVFDQLALTFLLTSCFSNLNPKYQEWLDEGKINDFFGYEVDYNLNSKYVMFYIESDDENMLEELIKEGLDVNNINEEILKELKRKFIGNSFSNINQLEGFTLDYIRSYLEGVDFFEEVDVIKSVTLEDVKNSIHFVENSSISKINLRKKSKI